ncbi:Tim44/TimA family putative adaptor protein [Coralliovum pocilloporae]|uniref:Tim44/TimA family putative adaptor protein n=1 Tax=Coralliovum pocilloporae TaxID=3066369 RepID=UPI0033071E19
MSFTSLFFLILAVVLFAYLRSILGRRTGNERSHHESNPYQQKTDSRQANDNVIALPRRDGEEEAPASGSDEEELKEQLSKFADPDTPLFDQITDLMSKDDNFHPEPFLDGARMAYEMIVTAYSSGDRKTLKSLLSKDVFDSFSGAIDDRESRQETVDFTFIGIDKAQLAAVMIVDQEIQVTVQFSSQLISATKNEDGAIVDGDPEQIVDVKDIWTFARPLKSRDPNWKLIATEAV